MSLSKTDYNFFIKAKKVAELSDFQKTHVGCVAIYKNTVIGIGCNSNKTHPVQKIYNRYRDTKNQKNPFIPKLHAEISCLNSIRHLDVNFQRVKIYIYRTRNSQEYGIARPCPSCMAAIRDMGIQNIYYTTDEGFAYERIDRKDTLYVA